MHPDNDDISVLSAERSWLTVRASGVATSESIVVNLRHADLRGPNTYE